MADHEYDFEICNSKLREKADELIKKFDELHHLDVGTILFVENHKYSGNKLAKTIRIPDRWRDILYQRGSATYLYVVEIFTKKTEELSEAQHTALLYQQLRQINSEGKVMAPDVSDWWQIIQALGVDWSSPDKTCPDILDPGFDFRKAS